MVPQFQKTFKNKQREITKIALKLLGYSHIMWGPFMNLASTLSTLTKPNEDPGPL